MLNHIVMWKIKEDVEDKETCWSSEKLY